MDLSSFSASAPSSASGFLGLASSLTHVRGGLSAALCRLPQAPVAAPEASPAPPLLAPAAAPGAGSPAWSGLTQPTSPVVGSAPAAAHVFPGSPGSLPGARAGKPGATSVPKKLHPPTKPPSSLVRALFRVNAPAHSFAAQPGKVSNGKSSFRGVRQRPWGKVRHGRFVALSWEQLNVTTALTLLRSLLLRYATRRAGRACGLVRPLGVPTLFGQS